MTLFSVRVYPRTSSGEEGPVLKPHWSLHDERHDPRFRDISENASYLDLEALLTREELIEISERELARRRHVFKDRPDLHEGEIDIAIRALVAPESGYESFRIVVSEYDDWPYAIGG